MHETISYLYCGITDSEKKKKDHQKNLCCIEVTIDRDEIKVKIPQCVGGSWVRISNFIYGFVSQLASTLSFFHCLLVTVKEP